MDDMDEIVQEFLVESHENLDQLDRDLVQLEQDPTSRDLLAGVFRTIHTIKGTSGFLAYGSLESVSHVGENLLSKLRDGDLLLTPARTSALLDLVDAIRSLLRSIEATGSEGSPDHTALVATLTALLDPAAGTGAVVAGPVVAEPVLGEPLGVAATAPAAKPRRRTARKPVAVVAGDDVPAPRDAQDEPAVPLLGEIMIESGRVRPEDVVIAVAEQRLHHDRRLGEILVDHGAASAQDVSESLEIQSEGRRSVADSTIRVDVELLDSLMRLVGELVLTRNQIVQQVSTVEDMHLQRASQRLNLIASELQEGVMKTRMQPIDNVWSKIPRVVRDLGVSCGKRVRVEMLGRDTELDKTVLEATKDPLIHLVRNAVDHGIESPESRRAAGKPEEGTLTLRAFHEGGQVVIEIEDDGKGLDPRTIATKAVERGLVTPDQLSRMSVREILNMVFLPGFSTAAKVTNVSGRGVGMDVVKTNMEKIGGTVDLSSEVGKGTTFRVKIPLTLAIIPALVIADGGDRYAIPQGSLLELVRLEAEQARAGIEMIGDTPVYRLRGRLLPLVSLQQLFGNAGSLLQEPGESGGAMHIVVLQADDRQFGLVVDNVHDTQEIVVKPLGPQLRGIGVFAGATIMGDGRVALILDVMGVAQRSGVVNEVRERNVGEPAGEELEVDDLKTMLVFSVGADRRVAMPLADVARLEEVPLALVERGAGQEVVQYRDSILPLVRLDALLGAAPVPYDPDREVLPVVVVSSGGVRVGLVVESILDIVTEHLAVRRGRPGSAVLGSAVVQSRVTDLLDVAAAIGAAEPVGVELVGSSW